MISESITIKNFGPIKNIHIEEIKAFTVFIGESASGKSTLLKVLALFRYLYKMQSIRSYLKHSNISKSPFRFTFDSYLKKSGLSEMVCANTIILYTVRNGDYAHSIIYQNGKLNGTSAVLDKSLLCYYKVSFVSEMRSVISAWADRGARLAGGYLGYYFHETYNDFEEAADQLKQYDLDFLKLKFSLKKSGNQKEYIITPSDNSHNNIKLRDASSGIQTSLPVSIIIRYFAQNYKFAESLRNSLLKYLFTNDRIQDFTPSLKLERIPNYAFIHVEEPELSLFPDAQCDLISNVVKSAFNEKNEDRNLGICIATHSPFIINHLNVLLKAGFKNKLFDGASLQEEQVAVYRLFDGELQDLRVQDNSTGQILINTLDLSETMHKIQQNFLSL